MGIRVLSLDHFSYFVLFLDTLPLYPKTFLTDETYQYSLKEIKPRISTSPLVQDYSSFKAELPEFPDILLIALNEKIMTGDRKCRSLLSETKKESHKAKYDDFDGSSAKKEAVKEVTPFSNDFSYAPTRFTSAFTMKDGHATDEDMRPVKRARVERSGNAIFSRSGRHELAESNFRFPEVRRLVVTHSESSPVVGSTVKPASDKVDAMTGEVERRELAEDSEVLESDRKDHETTPQKKNLRELKLLLSKISGRSPSLSSASDEGDKSQIYDSCSKTNLSGLFKKQSPSFNIIAKELPEINNWSIKQTHLSSENTKNVNSSAKDAGFRATEGEREEKVSPRFSDSSDHLKNCCEPKNNSANLPKQTAKASAHADQTSISFSQRISAVSRKTSAISTRKKFPSVTNSVGKIEYEFHSTTSESSRSCETASVRNGLPNPTKSDSNSEREKIEQKDDFIKPQRVSGDDKRGKRMTQQVFGNC